MRISNARAIEHDGAPIVALGISNAEATGTITAPVTTTTNISNVSLHIADTEADESRGWLRFDVTLSRPLDDCVCYDFETNSLGTAEAEVDYSPRPKTTLWMSPGQVADRTFVRIVDDSVPDSGETVVATISNARLCDNASRGIVLSRASATGTIQNDDPMLRAWLARFGRTVAEQTVDAVESRIRAVPRPGVDLTVAGQRIGTGATAKLRNETDRADNRWTAAQAVTPDELLAGSSFSLMAGSPGPGGNVGSFWGQGMLSSFDGREGADTVSGDVTSLMLGADWTHGSGAGSWTAGLMLSQSRGEGTYRGVSDGELSTDLTGLYPYGRYALNDRVTAWGTAGYGEGTLIAPGKAW